MKDKSAIKWLRGLKSSPRKEVKAAAEVLMGLVEQGTYANLTNEIKKIQKQDKSKSSEAQQEAILRLSQKYSAPQQDLEQEDDTSQSPPEIVISETFVA